MINQSNLSKLFSLELQDMYDAERRELKTLRILQENITSAELWALVMRYNDVVEEDVDILRNIFRLLNISPEGKQCYVVSDLLAEAESVMLKEENPEFAEADLVMNLQHIISYKMAAYSAASVYAMDLFHNELSMQLDKIKNNLEVFHDELGQLMALTIHPDIAVQADAVEVPADLPILISPNHITKLPMTVRQK